MINVIVIVALFVTVLLTGIVRKQAIKRSIIDIPNHRSSHDVPTPRGGGLAIAVVWYVGLVVLKVMDQIDHHIFYAIFGGLPLFVISFLDDLKDLSARVRIIFQALSAAIGTLMIFGNDLLHFDSGSWFLSLVFAAITFVGIIWFINLFNFLDGIDGYLGVESVFFFSAIFVFTEQSFVFVLVAACIGFLFWNWPKAKIFCGDVGSTMIGYNVAVVSIWLANTQQLNICIPIILSSIFWIDASYTIVKRALNKERITQPHRKHAYQRLVQSGLSHQSVVLISLGFNLMQFGVSMLYVNYLSLWYVWILLSALVGGIFLYFAHWRKPFV